MGVVEVATATPTAAPCKMPLRSWMFTINNPTQEDTDAIMALDLTRIKRLVVGREVGEKCGTPHYQGFMMLYKSARQGQVVAWLGGRAYVKPAPFAPGAAKYASKDANLLINHGSDEKVPRSEEGQTAAEHVIEMIDQGATVRQIWASHRVFFMYHSEKIVREYKRAKHYQEHPEDHGVAPVDCPRD